MKAIVINLDSQSSLPDISLYADSAIARDVMPLFVPDIDSEGWTLRVCVAVRISRLGKNIPEKFAMRYADAISMVAVLHPLSEQIAASGIMAIMDSAVTTGQWLEWNIGAASELSTCVNGTVSSYPASDLRIGACIHQVSRIATLKTGDIIILPATATEVSLHGCERVEASINSALCLNLKIK